MDLAEQIKIAARDLPAGYIIHLGMENGAAWVEVIYGTFRAEHIYPDGVKEFGFADDIDGADQSLAEQIQEAINLAIKHSEGRTADNE